MHADNPLFYELIRSAHDPDPLRAARFRPYSYSSARRPLDELPIKTVAAFDPAQATAFIRKAVGSIWGFVPDRRPVPVPCC